jgi:two-component system sensor histidine kinase/response regulator
MPRILVVDDSPDNVRVLQAILENQGFEVTAVLDPSLVFSAVFEIKPDLILMDVCMPGFDGAMVTRLLKRQLKQIPILLCSSLDESDLADRAATSGADGYVRKSASPREIVSRVGRMLRKKSPT